MPRGSVAHCIDRSMMAAMDGQGGGTMPDFVWDAEASSGADRYMFLAAAAAAAWSCTTWR